MVGHGSSDNAASYGVYAFGLLPRWTAVRDSITLTVHYDTPHRSLGLDGDRPLPVRADARCRRVPRCAPRKAARSPSRSRTTPDSDLAVAAEATIALGAGPELAVAATKTYVNTLGALALLAGHIAGRGAEIEAGIRGAPRQRCRTPCPAFEAATHSLALPFAYTGRMFVIGRGNGVRDGARDRAEAARDLPDRSRAADRDRPRARSGRGARSPLPGLGDRLGRRDAGHRAGGGCADPRDGCDARRERNGRHGRDGQLVPATGSTDGARLALTAAVGRPRSALRAGALPRPRPRPRRADGLNKVTLVT